MVGGFIGALLLSLAWYGVFVIVLEPAQKYVFAEFLPGIHTKYVKRRNCILDHSANLKELDFDVAHTVCHYSIIYLAAPSTRPTLSSAFGETPGTFTIGDAVFGDRCQCSSRAVFQQSEVGMDK